MPVGWSRPERQALPSSTQAKNDAKRPSLAQMFPAKAASKSAGGSPLKFKLKKTSEMKEEEEEAASRDCARGSGDTAAGKLEKTASFVSEGDSGFHDPGSPGGAKARGLPPAADKEVSRSLSW